MNQNKRNKFTCLAVHVDKTGTKSGWWESCPNLRPTLQTLQRPWETSQQESLTQLHTHRHLTQTIHHLKGQSCWFCKQHCIITMSVVYMFTTIQAAWHQSSPSPGDTYFQPQSSCLNYKKCRSTSNSLKNSTGKSPLRQIWQICSVINVWQYITLSLGKTIWIQVTPTSWFWSILNIISRWLVYCCATFSSDYF